MYNIFLSPKGLSLRKRSCFATSYSRERGLPSPAVERPVVIIISAVAAVIIIHRVRNCRVLHPAEIIVIPVIIIRVTVEREPESGDQEQDENGCDGVSHWEIIFKAFLNLTAFHRDGNKNDEYDDHQEYYLPEARHGCHKKEKNHEHRHHECVRHVHISIYTAGLLMKNKLRKNHDKMLFIDSFLIS